MSQRFSHAMSTTETATDNQPLDAIVIGGGIMGSCAAFELSDRGRSVLLLEQFDLLHHLGSSHGESRTIRSTYPEPYYTSMSLLSHSLWLRAESLAGYRVLTPSPHLDVGPSNSPSLLLSISSSNSHSIPHRLLTPPQLLSEFHSTFRIPDDWIAVVTDLGNGVLKPTKAVSMFQSLAAARGALLRDRVKVVGLHRCVDDSNLIAVSTNPDAVFLARKVIVTAGAWTRSLIKQAIGREIPIQPLHTTLCYWKIRSGHEEDLSIHRAFPTFASHGENYIYGTPAMEYPGLIKIALHGGRPCDPDRREWRTDLGEVGRTVTPFVETVMSERVEAEGGPVITQSCMYSMTPDGDFVIDYAGGEFGRDVVVAGGFSGHGFKMGPLVGRLLADMALGIEVKDVELGYFRADRFENDPGGNPKKFENPIPIEP